jgi:hypothetical protein
MNKKYTIFCDIDGVLMFHHYPDETCKEDYKPLELFGSSKKILEWVRAGHTIVLTTGRKESMRSVTEKQLSSLGIVYDHLIMGLTSGPRYLINDIKPDGTETAHAINIERNKGLGDVKI